jgi:hypothetical protein
MRDKTEAVVLKLSDDQALVLFDWLARFNQKGDQSFEDQAEQRVLYDVESMLEKALTASLDPRYVSLVADARARVRDGE